MPKLKTHTFNLSNNAGDNITCKSDVFVDEHGTFAVVIPDEYVLDISANLQPGCSVTQPRTKHRVESKDLNSALQSVKEGLLSLLNTQEQHEAVIQYQVMHNCLYAKDVDTNVIYPSVYHARKQLQLAEGELDRVNWNKNPNPMPSGTFDRTPNYSLSVQARVVRKITYTSNKGVRVVYDRIDRAEDTHPIDLGAYGTLLNGFTNIRMQENTPEIPYTEEAAQFFYNTMTSLCALAEKMQAFFGERHNVMNAITQGSSALGFSPIEHR